MGVIATLVYAMTMETSSSLWDCGEFVAAAYKQQVVHPPGSPLFLMIARVFTLFAPSPETIPVTMNFMSALCSGMAMMFLFWITTYMARKLLRSDEEIVALRSAKVVNEEEATMEKSKMFLILACGVVAALTGTFLDSIWFSAVEAEVYSMSLLFTAAVFWLALKWESVADEPYADRYLILIAFLQGCSIFVHWLNLLTIPAIALIYYFRRYEASLKGIVAALAIGSVILLSFLFLVITGIVDIMAIIEIKMVNDMGLPFNSGLIFSAIALVAGITAAIWFTRKKGWVGAQNVVLAFMFIMIGFSTISASVIRSNAGPNIDMNSPRDIVSLASYLHREQYGSRPLFQGYYYDAKPQGSTTTGKRYQKGKKRYDVVGTRFDYTYGKTNKKHFFPRIHDSSHKALYERWLGKKKNSKPTGWDNFKFFWTYQINHMYLRYLMWNFSGRQNDTQGTVDAKNGNWITGISFVDNMKTPLYGPRRMPYQNSSLPDHVKNDTSRNTYYMIPFLLALIGLFYQASRDKRRFTIVLFMFLLTGVALILYGNSPPIEPRERDYIFAASFYTFAIWVGLSVAALYSFLSKFLKGTAGVGLAFGLALIAPLLMGWQNWDDHDRSDRAPARDFAKNYLDSCAEGAILFTQGDNDTYPLWYAQEVEGIRRDVRVVNLSLLGVDWYINQCRRKVNDAAAVKMIHGPSKLAGSRRDLVKYQPNEQIAPAGKYFPLDKIINFVADDSKGLPLRDGDKLQYYPTKTVSIPVDRQKVIQNGTVHPDDQNKIVDVLKFTITKDNLYKPDLMILDIIAANNWDRPIYFAVSVDSRSFMGMDKYFQLEGLAYRLVPIEAPEVKNSPFKGRVQPSIMYDNLMNKFSFGNIGAPGVHLGTDVERMAQNFRTNYNRCADALIAEGRNTQAVEILDKAIAFLPNEKKPYDLYTYSTMLSFMEAGAYDKGFEVCSQMVDNLVSEIKWIDSIPVRYRKSQAGTRQRNLDYIKRFADMFKGFKKEDMAADISAKIKGL